MQLIESSPLGVRAALIRMSSPDARCTYTLFPMVHIGERNFYNEVVGELESHDQILLEGVKHRVISHATQLYAKAAASPRINLVTQSVMGKASHLKPKCRNIDISPEDFDKYWQQLPFWHRSFYPAALTLAFTYLRFFGTRSDIARVVQFQFRRSRKEILDYSEGPDVSDVIRDARDVHIVGEISRRHERVKDTPVAIAIVFGASHMRAIAQYLVQTHRYRAYDSRWLMVFH